VPQTNHIIGFVGFGILFFFCSIFGVLIEYVFTIGSDETDDSLRDKALVRSIPAWQKFFLAFSFSRNLRKMFWTPQKDNEYLSVFNGLRVISMFYIIFGHMHEGIGIIPSLNLQEVMPLVSSVYGSFVMGAFYSVDVFFYMSAFLGAYLMISKFEGKRMIPLHMIYFHRFLRILPTLGLFIALVLTFLEFSASGPLFELPKFAFIGRCSRYWWTNMLFINNFYPDRGER